MRLRAASMSLNVITRFNLGARSRACLFERCLGRGQSRNRNPKRTATDVIQTEPVTELNAGRLAAVFAANPELDVRPSFASQIASDFHQAANALLIDRRERICIHNVELRVGGKKTAGIVPAHSQRRLCEIVCAKTEELGVARDLVGHERSARDFDHRADQVFEFCSSFFCNFTSDATDDIDLKLEFARKSNQRNQDFGVNFDSLCLDFGGGFEDCACLHSGNLGKRDSEPATAMTQHRIELMQLMHALRDLIYGNAKLVRQFTLLGMIVRQKFMERGIEKTDRSRQAI